MNVPARPLSPTASLAAFLDRPWGTYFLGRSWLAFSARDKPFSGIAPTSAMTFGQGRPR
jgi:hypothetical protein